MFWVIATLTLGLFTYIVNRLLIKVSPSGKKFPLCIEDKELMAKIPVGRRTMPDEIKHYLAKWNLNPTVIRRYICKKCGRELWIAPEAGDMEKSLFV
jgi:hypothetical protein